MNIRPLSCFERKLDSTPVIPVLGKFHSIWVFQRFSVFELQVRTRTWQTNRQTDKQDQYCGLLAWPDNNYLGMVHSCTLATERRCQCTAVRHFAAADHHNSESASESPVRRHCTMTRRTMPTSVRLPAHQRSLRRHNDIQIRHIRLSLKTILLDTKTSLSTK